MATDEQLVRQVAFHLGVSCSQLDELLLHKSRSGYQPNENDRELIGVFCNSLHVPMPPLIGAIETKKDLKRCIDELVSGVEKLKAQYSGDVYYSFVIGRNVASAGLYTSNPEEFKMCLSEIERSCKGIGFNKNAIKEFRQSLLSGKGNPVESIGWNVIRLPSKKLMGDESQEESQKKLARYGYILIAVVFLMVAFMSFDISHFYLRIGDTGTCLMISLTSILVYLGLFPAFRGIKWVKKRL